MARATAGLAARVMNARGPTTSRCMRVCDSQITNAPLTGTSRLAGQESNLQLPDPKSGVLPIELPAIESASSVAHYLAGRRDRPLTSLCAHTLPAGHERAVTGRSRPVLCADCRPAGCQRALS